MRLAVKRASGAGTQKRRRIPLRRAESTPVAESRKLAQMQARRLHYENARQPTSF